MTEENRGLNPMSGRPLLFGILRLFRRRGSKQIRPQQAQVHQACARDTVVSPLGDSASCYLANTGNFGCSAKGVNDVIRVHTAHLRQLRVLLQAV